MRNTQLKERNQAEVRMTALAAAQRWAGAVNVAYTSPKKLQPGSISLP